MLPDARETRRMLIDTAQIMRRAKLYEIGAGTSEIRRMLIGRELVEGG